MFIVNLPDGYSISYDKSKFINTFPNSMITLALQSDEKEIPLSHPLVTKDILEFLREIMEGRDYPLLSGSVRKSLDYLGIDLPEFIYDPEYPKFTTDNPSIHFNINMDWDLDYETYLNISPNS